MFNYSKEDKLQIGIIGCGGIANGKHMAHLAKLNDIEMVAFCDIVEKRAKRLLKIMEPRNLRHIQTIGSF